MDQTTEPKWGDLWADKVVPNIPNVDGKIERLYRKAVELPGALVELFDDAIELHKLMTNTVLDENYGRRVGGLLSEEKNRRPSTLLQKLWKSEKTFYPRIFLRHRVLSRTDDNVILSTIFLLQNLIQRLTLPVKRIAEKSKKNPRLLETIARVRARRGLPTPETNWNRAITETTEMLEKEALKEVQKPKLTVPYVLPKKCDDPARILEQEKQRQRAITFWARAKYAQIMAFLNNTRESDNYITDNYRRAFARLEVEFNTLKEILFGKRNPNLLEMGENMAEILTLNARDQWTRLFRHLTYLQLRGLLPDETVRKLRKKDGETLKDVFGNTALSPVDINCISEWADRYRQMPDPEIGSITIQMRFHVKRHTAFLELLRQALADEFVYDIVNSQEFKGKYPATWLSRNATSKDLDLERVLMQRITSCIGCNGEAAQFCGGCASETAYCGVECQQKDWINHKHTCDFLHLKQ
jgi:MYND finger